MGLSVSLSAADWTADRAVQIERYLVLTESVPAQVHKEADCPYSSCGGGEEVNRPEEPACLMHSRARRRGSAPKPFTLSDWTET